MPNAIKYNVSAQTLALRRGNFWIGTGDVPKGTTANTDYWNGLTPPSGGYTIYLNKATGGPSIYVANNDSELIFLTNRIVPASYRSVAECLAYFSTQTDKMVFNIDYSNIITNGIDLVLDAGFRPSYPTSGITWYDLSKNVYNGTLVNGPAHTGFGIVLDGIDDYCSTTLSKTFASITIQVWFYGDGNQPSQFSGLVANRSPSNTNVAGLLLNNNGNQSLGYNWNNSPDAYNWDSGLILDYFGWHFLSLSVSPSSATGFLNGVSSTNNIGHSPLNLADLAIGKDYLTNRYVQGEIGLVLIYDRALSNEEVVQNYNATIARFPN